MGNLERRDRKLEGPRGKREAMSFEHPADEELNVGLREFEDVAIADPETCALARGSIIYKREHGHGREVRKPYRERIWRSVALDSSAKCGPLRAGEVTVGDWRMTGPISSMDFTPIKPRGAPKRRSYLRHQKVRSTPLATLLLAW